MASHRDMKALGDDIAAVKRLAIALLGITDAEWTDWERLFLDGLAERRSAEPLSQRQREILVDLRDGAQSFATIHGLSVKRLIEDCWLARLDLAEDEQAFIESLKAEAPARLKRRPLYRLYAVAQSLDLVPRFAETG